eukprot:CAMPEP_0182502570 /NCGR_PEP_ID=MMETSP1321-20130603/13699_1 /TAXON_ID=91990 /ORGANISM="Bolidomonas sp., Strain RCC1657" /LENGTH=348 /DNA_ID=CAMNT_0024707535 /DNA_START=194 /DNA_END=1237 /DNA_ORIENTATION=-
MRLLNLCHRATYIFVVLPNDDLLVQKRSNLKDYRPGYYDPTPGGVVGYGETYGVNAERELREEMGLSADLEGMFRFYYKDEGVDCWGAAYLTRYDGEIDDLELQEEEVSGVEAMSVDEILEREENGDKFTKDSTHAVRLYKQWKEDHKISSSSKIIRNVDTASYTLRSAPKAVFFDCDDCLYFDGWKVAQRLTDKIEEWCVEKKGLKPGEAYSLYKQWGTALLGLIKGGHLSTPSEIDSYLSDVHDVGVSNSLKPDIKLRELLLSLDPAIPKYVFTASVKSHAKACLEALGVADIFGDNIIDTKVCGLQTKHSKESFEKAMEYAGVGKEDVGGCVFFDDSVKNIRTAK